MTVVALLAALGTLRLITAFVFANGIAALTVAGVAWPFRSNAAWIAELCQFSLEVGILCLASAMASWLSMPSVAAIRRREASDGPGAFVETLLLAGLAIVAGLQVPALLNWLTEDRALLRQLIGTGTDPFGFNLIPAAMLFSLPALATAALLTFAATSIGTMSAPRRVATAVLLSGIILQTGLMLVEYVALGAIEDIGGAVTQALESAPDMIAAQAADWFMRHDRTARDMNARLVAIFVGYVLTLAISTYAARSAAPENTALETAADPDGSPVDSVPQSPISQASAMFDHPQYVLRVRQAFAAFLLPGSASYDIDTMPPSARTRFSFSWATGVLRREPAGPDVLQITAGERHGLFKRSYLVTEVATGTVLGKLVPSGLDWEILDAYGRPLSTVMQTTARFDREQYVMRVGGADVCRFTWITTFTAAAGDFEVEYLPGADERFDRALPMALAPVLERAARRRMQRS